MQIFKLSTVVNMARRLEVLGTPFLLLNVEMRDIVVIAFKFA